MENFLVAEDEGLELQVYLCYREARPRQDPSGHSDGEDTRAGGDVHRFKVPPAQEVQEKSSRNFAGRPGLLLSQS